MSLEYVRNYYGVPAEINRRVMIGISNTDRRCLEWAERNDIAGKL